MAAVRGRISYLHEQVLTQVIQSLIYIYTYTCNHNKSKTMNLARAVGRAGCKGWITASVEQLEKEEAAARGKEQK